MLKVVLGRADGFHLSIEVPTTLAIVVAVPIVTALLHLLPSPDGKPSGSGWVRDVVRLAEKAIARPPDTAPRKPLPPLAPERSGQ